MNVLGVLGEKALLDWEWNKYIWCIGVAIGGRGCPASVRCYGDSIAWVYGNGRMKRGVSWHGCVCSSHCYYIVGF